MAAPLGPLCVARNVPKPGHRSLRAGAAVGLSCSAFRLVGTGVPRPLSSDSFPHLAQRGVHCPICVALVWRSWRLQPRGPRGGRAPLPHRKGHHPAAAPAAKARRHGPTLDPFFSHTHVFNVRPLRGPSAHAQSPGNRLRLACGWQMLAGRGAARRSQRGRR